MFFGALDALVQRWAQDGEARIDAEVLRRLQRAQRMWGLLGDGRHCAAGVGHLEAFVGSCPAQGVRS